MCVCVCMCIYIYMHNGIIDYVIIDWSSIELSGSVMVEVT